MPIQPSKICSCAFLQPDFMKRWGSLEPDDQRANWSET
jgi:hypothetical protein